MLSKPLSQGEGLALGVPDEGLQENDIALLEECRICPRECGINRFKGPGLCREDARIKVASINLHHGEEPPISGTKGSGTVFFTGCNMSCIFCQNFPLSQLGKGRYITVSELAAGMLKLQKRGAHNINFVTPSHYTVQIKRAVMFARDMGLSIPIVYNTSGYDSLWALDYLEGIVDIYLADIRYQTAEAGKKYSGVSNYPRINKAALKKMFDQVGVLQVDENGIGKRGMIIRHLVLPEGLAETEKALRFIRDELSKDIPISLMSQYFPAWKAKELPPLDRRISNEEYEIAKNAMEALGLEEGWMQELE